MSQALVRNPRDEERQDHTQMDPHSHIHRLQTRAYFIPILLLSLTHGNLAGCLRLSLGLQRGVHAGLSDRTPCYFAFPQQVSPFPTACPRDTRKPMGHFGWRFSQALQHCPLGPVTTRTSARRPSPQPPGRSNSLSNGGLQEYQTQRVRLP